ncbi:MAG: hypothetical protein ACE5JG_08835 [Planctomycetota bacterium]
MFSRLVTSAKLASLITVVLLAGIAVLFVFDVFEGEEARDAAVKVLWLMGIFAVASFAIAVIAGSGRRSADSET